MGGSEVERLERLRWDALDAALAELRLCRSALELTECAGELALVGCAADAVALSLITDEMLMPWVRAGGVSLLESDAPVPAGPVAVDDAPTLEQQVIRSGQAGTRQLRAPGGRLVVVAAIGSGHTVRGLLHVVGVDLDVEIISTYANAVGSMWELTDVRRRTQDQCDAVTRLRRALGGLPKRSIELVHVAVASPGGPIAFPDPQSDTTTELARLTTRQREVLNLMATGLSNAEIAERLVVAVSTVKSHVRAVFRATGATNRSEATARFARIRVRNVPQDSPLTSLVSEEDHPSG